jgi:hypothetical protein
MVTPTTVEMGGRALLLYDQLVGDGDDGGGDTASPRQAMKVLTEKP